MFTDQKAALKEDLAVCIDVHFISEWRLISLHLSRKAINDFYFWLYSKNFSCHFSSTNPFEMVMGRIA